MKRRTIRRRGRGRRARHWSARRPGRRPRSAATCASICGFAPGGTADLLCRILADAVTPEIGQKVIVDTKTGASGFIANETVANAAPDGRTIGLAAMAAMCVSPVMPGQKLPINVDTDLTPIASIAGVYNMLVFGKHVPFRTVPELIEQAKKNPGKLSYASAGNGTSQHLAGELFKKMAGVNLLHVPYRGGAPAIQDMVAGNCDMMFGNMPEFLGQIGGGGSDPDRLRLAACPRRCFPNLPLISQFLPGFEVVNWFAVFGSQGPAGRPDRRCGTRRCAPPSPSPTCRSASSRTAWTP